MLGDDPFILTPNNARGILAKRHMIALKQNRKQQIIITVIVFLNINQRPKNLLNMGLTQF